MRILRAALVAKLLVLLLAGCASEPPGGASDDAGSSGDPGERCTQESDAELCARSGASCGRLVAMDNCGAERTVDSCGGCAAGKACEGNACVCEAESDAAFCARAGKNCGTVTGRDVCGETRTAECGSCSAPETCGGGGVANVCACAPESNAEFCARNGKSCGAFSGPDNCGRARTASCGSCRAPETCGGGGTPNVCGCAAESDAAFCARLGRNCGAVTAADNCGASRTAECGSCTAPESCGGGGTANVCGCTAESDAAFCARQGRNCGQVTAADNCGASRTTSCGSCAFPETCGGGGADNVCGCTAESDDAFCARLGKNCGAVTAADNCGASRTAECGSCTAPESCGGGGTSNVCGCTAESDAAFCARHGKDCGQLTAGDNCGASRTAGCGGCPAGQSCGAESANVCGCVHACDEGAAECADGQRRSCVAGAGGCRIWSAATACADGFCEDETRCGIDVDECALGTAACPANSSCSNTPGSYTCNCNCGYVADGAGGCVDAYPNVIFVDAARPANGDGACWASAFKDLASALAAAQPGDELWVARGTYTPGPVALATLTLRPQVSLYGGFKGTETSREERDPALNKTTLSGALGASSSYHIMTAPLGIEPDTVVDGFHFEKGNTQGASENYGAALLARGNPTLRNCTFTSNSATYGAAVAAVGGHPTIEDSRFDSNSGLLATCIYVNGPGSAVTVRRTTFKGTSQQCIDLGEGVEATIEDSSFTGYAASWGGAVRAVDATASFLRTTFTDNTGYYEGGAIYSLRSHISLKDSGFFDNSGWDGGGGIWQNAGTLEIDGCTFRSNDNSSVHASNSPSGFIRSSRFETDYRTAVVFAGATTLPISNSLFLDNAMGAISVGGGHLQVFGSSFVGNRGTYGAAIFANQGSVTVVDSEFRGNTSTSGAIYTTRVGGLAPVRIVNTVFDGNAGTNGAALNVSGAELTVLNCRFSGNRGLTATSGSGSVIDGFMSDLRVINSSFAGNVSPAAGLLIANSSVDPNPPISVINSVFWANSPAALPSSGVTLSVSHSCVETPQTGTGNILLSASPFVDHDGADDLAGTADDDLHLAAGSPCRDAGLASALPADLFDLDGDGDVAEPVPVDLDGNPRVQGPALDIGAYEAP